MFASWVWERRVPAWRRGRPPPLKPQLVVWVHPLTNQSTQHVPSGEMDTKTKRRTVHSCPLAGCYANPGITWNTFTPLKVSQNSPTSNDTPAPGSSASHRRAWIFNVRGVDTRLLSGVITFDRRGNCARNADCADASCEYVTLQLNAVTCVWLLKWVLMNMEGTEAKNFLILI